MRHIFIVNPVSGKADASGTLVPQIIDAAKKLNIAYEILLTEYPRHAVELAAKAAESGEPIRLYACGGDGTLNEALQGTLHCRNVEVACVPCGSGNDFVRNFGGKDAFLNLEDLIQGFSVPMDLIRTDHGIAVAICSAGLDAQVAYGIPKFRRIPMCGGEMAYKLSILQAVCSKLGHRLRIRADDECITDDFLMLAICNGSSYGGGFVAAPQAQMNDGLLDLVMVRKISRLQISRFIGVYKNGKHMQDGKVAPPYRSIIEYRRVKKVELETLDGIPIIVTEDGECAPRHTLKTSILPKAAQIILPKSFKNQKLSVLKGMEEYSK